MAHGTHDHPDDPCNQHLRVRVGAAEQPGVWTSDGRVCLGGLTRGHVREVCRDAGSTAPRPRSASPTAAPPRRRS